MYIRVGTRSITPNKPVYLLGHAIRTEISTGILDDIEVNTIVYGEGADAFVWMSYDLAGLDGEALDIVKSAIIEKHGVKFSRIVCTATHTHAGPEFSGTAVFFDDDNDRLLEGYREFMIAQMIVSVDDAFEKELIACEPYMASMQVEGIYSNRNGLEYYYDPTLTAIKWVDGSGKVQGGVVNFNCHATVLGPQNLEVSGDIFGYIRRKVAADWGVNPLIIQSTSGDVSNRMHRQGNDFAELQRVGDDLYTQMSTKLKYEKIDMTLINEEDYHFEDHYEVPIEERKEALEKIKYNIEHAPNFDIMKIFSSAKGYMEMMISRNITKFDVAFDCHIYHFKDVIVCTMPAELNSILGKVIKESRTDKPVLVWGYCDELRGYIVEEAMHGQTFESFASQVRKGKGEMIVADLAEIIKKM